MAHNFEFTALGDVPKLLLAITEANVEALRYLELLEETALSDALRWVWNDDHRFNLLSIPPEKPAKWELQVFPNSRIFFQVGARAIGLGCWVRWSSFLKNSHVRRETRRICCSVAENLRSDKLIYIPDSAWPPAEKLPDNIFEGLSIDEIEEHLAADSGLSAKSLSEIENGDFNTNCWIKEELK